MTAAGAGAIVWGPAEPELRYEQRITYLFSHFFAGLFSILLRIKFIAAVSWVCTHIIEPVTAFLTVSYVSLTDQFGRKQAVSFINNTDPAFKTGPYKTEEFPFDSQDADENGYHEWVAHFLCLAIKLAYEEAAVIKQVVKHEWNWDFKQYFETDQRPTTENVLVDRTARGSQRLHTSPAEDRSAKIASNLIPDTHASVISNEHAVVLFFRGTTPSNLAEWWTDSQADLHKEPGIITGACHAGWFEALFYPVMDENRPSIFQRICQTLVEELGDGSQKRLYITGHSLGAGLASIFAHVLATLSDVVQDPTTSQGKKHATDDEALEHKKKGISVDGVSKLFSQLEGVFTFAGPLAGDATFVDFMARKFTGPEAPKLFRILHSSDIVPKVPLPVMGYRHHPLEHFLSFDGFIYTDPQDIQLAKATEVVFFIRIYCWKFLKNWTVYAPDGNNAFFSRPWTVWLVKLSRCFFHSLIRLTFALTVLVGLVDHWPSEYEQKLRVMAQELNAYLHPTPGQPPANPAVTHLMSRVRPEDVAAALPVQHLHINGGPPHH